jgi:exodeoxyribonuclease VII large subunit
MGKRQPVADQPADQQFQRDVYTVSRLNSEVRSVLEGSFPLLWVEGELSNLARPASGHIYFSLKDAQAQVRCAMFRMKRQLLRFQPENGTRVLLRARVGLYEGRGEFQLIVEHMEAAGEGALRQAFEALKQRLAAEGLFDSGHKLPLPTFPRRIGVITSPSGAAIRDILTVLERRFPAIPVIVYPVPVQGDEAASALVEMIRLADQRGECDLLILARGGGSLEDLMAFNDEGVARAIHAATIPTVSAVGHEIDFTIADFVADRRAATPSAAAEMASPDRDQLNQRLSLLDRRLVLQLRQRLGRYATQMEHARQRLQRCHPGARLQQQQQRLDERDQRLRQEIGNLLRILGERLATLHARLAARTPAHRLQHLAERRLQLERRLAHALTLRLQNERRRLAETAGGLHALSPLATLERGYSITRRLPGGEVLRDAYSTTAGEQLQILLARGSLVCRVESRRKAH